MSLSLSPEKKGYSSKGTAQPLERIGLWPENPVKRISSKTLTLPFLQKYTYVFIYCTNILQVFTLLFEPDSVPYPSSWMADPACWAWPARDPGMEVIFLDAWEDVDWISLTLFVEESRIRWGQEISVAKWSSFREWWCPDPPPECLLAPAQSAAL